MRSAKYAEEGTSGSHASTFGDFHTPGQGSAMKFLNAGSTQTGLIGLIDTAVGSPSEDPGFVNIFCRLGDVHFQTDETRPFSHALITICSFGASGPYVQALRVHDEERNARCRGRRRSRDTGSFESWIQEFRAWFLFGYMTRIAMLVAEVAENGDSGYIVSYTYQEFQGGLLVCVRNEQRNTRRRGPRAQE
ncbi:hypothetical protein D6C80_06487 [Aureobasidium pullulans]|nr:hypothetical protein D6C80_06487 [Aureobasidium pullulans]